MRISLSPDLSELAPGQDVDLTVTIRNDGAEPLSPSIGVSGADPQLVSFPEAILTVAPGGTSHTLVRVRVPDDARPGDQRIGVTVEDPDGLHTAASGSAVIVVGAPPAVSLELAPATVRGRRRAKLDTILRSSAAEPITVRLEGVGDDVEVDFHADEVVLQPGEAVRVPTRMRRRRRSWFGEVRHGALVRARGRGAPVSATATFRQAPFLPPLLLKLLAALTALAVWAAAVVYVHDRVTSPAADPAAEAAAGDDADGADGASGGADGDAGADGEGADGEDAVGGVPVVVAGAATGPRDLTGTAVVIERIAFGDAGTTSGSAGTKLAAMTPVVTTVGSVIEKVATTTDDRGRFRFSSGLTVPAYYRVTATRPGFEVASHVVTTSDEAREFELALAMVPADGALSGRVTDAGGSPVGGATVTVTDGTLTFQTTSATDGTVGSWSLDGIATPATYQVIAAKRGYATATSIVELDGGQQLGGVDLQLQANLGTVRGRVSSRDTGIGAVTVALSGDEVERTTTTLTAGNLAGTFDFPALPYGTYDVTFSAPGWLTQTATVTVDRGDVELRVRDLTRATAVVQGVVEQEVFGACQYPDPEVPTQRDQLRVTTCGGVGVSLVGDAGTYRTTTATGTGTFTLSGVAAGDYVLAFSRAGYRTEYFEVSLRPGTVRTVPRDAARADTATTASFTPASFQAAAAPDDRVLLRLLPEADDAVGVVHAVVRSTAAPNAVFTLPANTRIGVVGQPDAQVELTGDGGIEVTGVRPGAMTLRIDAPGYDVRDEVVRVASSGVSDAGIIQITPLASLSLRVTDSSEFPVVGAEVFVATAPGGHGRLSDVTDPGVRLCDIERDAAGRVRVVPDDPAVPVRGDGLCATVGAGGDVVFTQALGTGEYRIVTPVNADDIEDVPLDDMTLEQRVVRAGVVPLDHQQLQRDIAVRSGETTRLDIRARRYAVIEGRIREPREDGFANVDAAAFVKDDADGLRFFPAATTYLNDNGEEVPLGISLDMTENGNPVVPPDGLGPRLSFGPADGLPVGVYRINRVLPDDVERFREFRLGFYNNEELQYEYQGSNVLSGLVFGDTVTANAVLNPAPIPVTFEVVRQLSSGDEVPVAGMQLTVEGITEYRFEGGSVFPLYQEIVVTTDATGLARAVDVHGDEVRFLQAQPLRINGRDDDNAYELLNVDPDDGNAIVPVRGQNVKLLVRAVPRTVSGSVQLVPSGTTGEAGVLNGLEVSMAPVLAGGGLGTPIVVASGDRFVADGRLHWTLPAVPPDDYHLLVSGSGVFDHASGDLHLQPGPPSVPVPIGPQGPASPAPPFLVDRSLTLHVDVTEIFPAGSTAPLPVDDVEVRVLLNGTQVDVRSTGASGRATFPQLRGGPGRDYQVVVHRTGYRPVQVSGTFLLTDVTTTAARSLVRFGSVEGELVSWLSDDEPDVGRVAGASVQLRTPDGQPVPGIPSVTADPDGTFVFPAELEIPAGAYQLLVSQDQHQPTTLPVTVVDATVTDLGRHPIQLRRAGISGTVTDAPSGLPLPHVRVRAVHPDDQDAPDAPGARVYAAATTDALGQYQLTDLPPRALTLVFDEFTDATLQVETSRMRHDRPVTATPGGVANGDIALTRQYSAISGRVQGQTFARPGAPTRLLDGADVVAVCQSASCGLDTRRSPDVEEDGTYVFEVLPVGTYHVEFAHPGYDPVGTPASPVVVQVHRFAAAPAPVDATLVATPVATTVTVSSDDGLGALAGVTVTPTYVRPAGATDDPTADLDDRYVFSGISDEQGRVSLVLPPGDWTLATSGAQARDFLPRPHLEAVATPMSVAVGDPVDATLPLPAFVRVTGDVLGREHPNATATALAGSTVTPSPDGGGAGGYASDATVVVDEDGTARATWSVYLAPTPATDDDQPASAAWTLHFAAEHRDTGSVGIDVPAGALDLVADVDRLRDPVADGTGIPPAITAAGVALTATPVAVDVGVVSDVAAEPALAGIEVVATWAGDPDLAPPALPYRTRATTAAGTASLSLAPGPWALTTEGAQTVVHLPQRPHVDVTGAAAVDVTVPFGAAAPSPLLELPRYVALTGIVAGRHYAGAATTPLGGATVTPTSTGVTLPAFAGTSAPTAGTWTAYVPPSDVATSWRVAVQRTSYDTGELLVDVARADRPVDAGYLPQTVTDVFPAVVSGNAVVLTATPVPFVVTVASENAETGALAGVTVAATFPGTPAVPVTPRYVLTGATGPDGRITLRLPPAAAGAWRLATTGAQSVSPPHRDQTNVAANAIPVGGAPTQTLTLDEDLTLTVRVFESLAPNVRPVDGVSVQLYRRNSNTGCSGGNWTAIGDVALTAPDGTVQFAGLQTGRGYRVTVSKDGWIPPGSPTCISQLSTSVANVLNVALPPYGSVTGSLVTLLDAQPSATPLVGDALVGATLTLSAGTASSTTTSGAGGAFRFANTEKLASGNYTLTITAAGHQTRTVTSVAVANGTTRDLGELRVTAQARVRGAYSGPARQNMRVTGLRAAAPAAGTTISSSMTAAGSYDLSALPPRDLRLRFEEFQDAAGTVATSRPVVEVDVTGLTPGADRLVNVTLPNFAAVSGTVTGRDHATADPVALVGAQVVARCTVTTANGCTSGQTTSTTTGAGGSYAFTSLRVGTYRILTSQAGYGDESSDAVVVARMADETSTSVVDPVLTASPRTVDVHVVSSDGAGALEGLEVTATHGTLDAVEVETDEAGVASFTGTEALAPGEWTFTTAGGDVLEPPHVDLAATDAVRRTFAVGTAPLVLDQATGARQRLTLTRYVQVSGRLVPQAYAGGPVLNVLDDAVVSLGDGTRTRPATVEGLSGGAATWVADVPPSAADVTWTVTAGATHYTPDATVTVDVAATDTSAPDVTLVAAPVPTTVQVTADEDPVPDVEVTATLDVEAPELPESGYLPSAVTGADGEAGLVLAPGTWTLTPAPGPDYDGPAYDWQPLTDVVVALGSEPQPELVLVLADDPDDGDPDGGDPDDGDPDDGDPDDGDPDDGDPDGEPEVGTTEVTGFVVDELGAPVSGAVVTASSSFGTASVDTDVDGAYTLEELDAGVTWRITFEPPDGTPGQPVTRFVAAAGQSAVVLEQTIPNDYGELRVQIAGGDAGDVVDLTLEETGPFPTIAEDGRLDRIATLDVDGTATVTFTGLVPGSRGLAANRFAVRAAVDGRQDVVSSGHDVVAGQVTTVELHLGGETTRTVVLTVTSDGEPLVDRTVQLVRDGVVRPATAPPGSNEYTVSGVSAGTWDVVVPTGGFAPAQIQVSAGTGVHEADVDLVALPPDDTGPTPEPEDPGTGPDDPEPDPGPTPPDGEPADPEGPDGPAPDDDTEGPGDATPEGPDTPDDPVPSPEGGAETT